MWVTLYSKSPYVGDFKIKIIHANDLNTKIIWTMKKFYIIIFQITFTILNVFC